MLKKIAILLCVLGLLLCAACGSEQSSDLPDKEGKIELTMACSYADQDITGLISDFNKQSSDCKITLVEYDQLGDRDRLLTEITTGNAPDLFAFYAEFMDESKNSSAFEDLLPYLDSDSDCGRAVIVPSLLGAMTRSGRLNCMPFDFSLTTFYVQRSLLGKNGSLTMEQAEKLAKESGSNLSVFPPWMTRETLLSYVYQFSLGRFIDEKNLSCSFDSPDFVALLKQCKQQVEVAAESSGEISEAGLLRELPTQRFSLLLNPKMLFGDDYCFVGFPTEDGGASSLDINLRFYMSSLSEHKGEAWEFIRYALSEAGQELAQNIPATQKGLDAMIAQGLAEGKSSNENNNVGLTQLDADKFLALIKGTKTVGTSRQTIYNIIMEEASAYFAGGKTAQEATNLIQNRVKIYLAE